MKHNGACAFDASAAISVASSLALACAPAWERRLLMPLPAVAAGLVLVALVLLIVGLWSEHSGEDYWTVFGTALVLAAWGVLVLARLAPRYRWTFFAAAGLTLVLTLLGVVALWGGSTSDAFARLAGAVAVLSAAFVLTVPVPRVPAGAGTGLRQRFSVTAHAAGGLVRAGACDGCGAGFRVEFLEP